MKLVAQLDETGAVPPVTVPWLQVEQTWTEWEPCGPCGIKMHQAITSSQLSKLAKSNQNLDTFVQHHSIQPHCPSIEHFCHLPWTFSITSTACTSCIAMETWKSFKTKHISMFIFPCFHYVGRISKKNISQATLANMPRHSTCRDLCNTVDSQRNSI